MCVVGLSLMHAAAVQRNWIMRARAKHTLLYFILFSFFRKPKQRPEIETSKETGDPKAWVTNVGATIKPTTQDGTHLM